MEAIERLRRLCDGQTIDAFELDWQSQWLVERGVEIISEASRHLPDDMKARHPDIPWKKVAGIGNVLRHDYGNVAPAILWALVRKDLPALEKVCRDEWMVSVAVNEPDSSAEERP
jgi:uncharacterized protein with HEPN domain